MALDPVLDEKNRAEYEVSESRHYRDEAEKRIKVLERAVAIDQRILEVLVAAGHVTKEQIEGARKLVASLA